MALTPTRQAEETNSYIPEGTPAWVAEQVMAPGMEVSPPKREF